MDGAEIDESQGLDTFLGMRLGPLDDGRHTISVEVVDRAGNSGRDQVTITVRTQYNDTPLIVDPEGSGTQNYHAIQEAINHASDDDKIIVKAGTYPETNINFGGKKILLISESGPGSTIIDGGGKDTVIKFNGQEDGGSIVDGFTIKNGMAAKGEDGKPGPGGGISITNGASPVIRNCWIIGNTARQGAGIYCSGQESRPVIMNNKIIGNRATGGSEGGGIYVDGSSPVIINNIISFNQADSTGGGVFVGGGGSPIITNNEMDGNSALYGGGIYCGGGSLVVKNNIIINSPGGDGIYVVQGCDCDIDYNAVWNNTDNNYNVYGQPLVAVGEHDVTEDPQLEPGGRLKEGSPCVEAGDNKFVLMVGVKQDKFGNERIVDGDGDGEAVVDIGVYEMENKCKGDVSGGNQDHVVDGRDLVEFASEYMNCTENCDCDFNHDGVVNWKDLEVFVHDFGRTECP